jgi:SAM-dependent methyltransferase
MIRQRPAGAAPAVRATAEALPLADGAVDAALAVLTVHHWTDPSRGLAELRRVARSRLVVLTWDQDVADSFWLVDEYFPRLREVDRRKASLAAVVAALRATRIDVRSLPVPHDCADGFLGAFWRRPEAYLDVQVRAGISTFAELPRADLDTGLRRLAADIRSGAWADRHRDLLVLDELDLGYRLVVAER